MSVVNADYDGSDLVDLASHYAPPRIASPKILPGVFLRSPLPNGTST